MAAVTWCDIIGDVHAAQDCSTYVAMGFSLIASETITGVAVFKVGYMEMGCLKDGLWWLLLRTQRTL